MSKAPYFGESTKQAVTTLGEIGQILAAGLMRVLARKSSQTSAEGGDSSLDISPSESGHRPIDHPEKPR
jgi:hypothetical protein